MAYEPPVLQASVHHVLPYNTWTLTLNRYQRDNLLWLLNACGYGRLAIEPFHLLHTGDWNGELVNMLAKVEANTWPRNVVGSIDENDRPNKSFQQLEHEVVRWKNS